MAYKLYDYQQNAVDATINIIKKGTDPVVLDLATGAGKSIIIANIAFRILHASNKRILCLAPSKELVEQNFEKYVSYGYDASMYCASSRQKKSLDHNVIFGSPQSVLNSIDYFKMLNFAAVIIDEAHKTTDTIKSIISLLRESNQNLRVIGLTATPYRMRTGYIYRIDEKGLMVDEEHTINPFYKKLVCRVGANYLIENGYLTKPILEATIDNYDTSKLKLSSTGEFTAESLRETFIGKGRLTANIVNQVIDLTHDRKSVMFFGATIEHAYEIADSLPDGTYRVVTGKTTKYEREQILNDFKAFKFKYIVNVAVLTTGFDAPAVDCVAILRATSSASLLQQIIGRGLRLYPGKDDCLILDYAENIEKHELENDLFNPKVTAYKTSSDNKIVAICESCGTSNEFIKRHNPMNLKIDINGYFLDLDGNRILTDDLDEPLAIAAHFGRRCNMHWQAGGVYERCVGRWSFKVCKQCEAENDIAAKYCIECRHELVDPNAKLKLKMIRMGIDFDLVENWRVQKWITRKGENSIRIDYDLKSKKRITIWYFPESYFKTARIDWNKLCDATTKKKVKTADGFISLIEKGAFTIPKSISFYKRKQHYAVGEYNVCESVREQD